MSTDETATRHGWRSTQRSAVFGSCLWIGLVLLVFACASQAQSAAKPAAESQSQAAAEPSDEGRKSIYDLIQPPDGVWLKDEEGREYYLHAFPKVEGFYSWVDEEKRILRVRNHPPIIVHSEDENHFYTKIYKPDASMRRPLPRDVGPSPEELAAAAKTYEFPPLEEVDRIELVPFDSGLPRRQQWRNQFDLADMNGDGHLDILHGPARKSQGPPVIFLGNGAGEWRVWQEARFPDRTFDYGAAASGDFNGDGHLDIALGMHLLGMMVMVGDGEGGFEFWSRGMGLLGEESSPPGRLFTTRGIAVTDLNGDGRQDVLGISEGPSNPRDPKQEYVKGKIAYLNEGDGSWAVASSPDVDHTVGSTIELADLDGDGRLDIATNSLVQGYDKLLNYVDQEGEWQLVSLDGLRPKAIVWGVEAADFDGDGRSELVVTYISRELGVRRFGLDLFRAGDEGAWVRRPIFATEDAAFSFRSLGSGDLDGDGNRDLVALLKSGSTWVLLGDGKGGFSRELSPELEPDLGHQYCAGWDVRLIDVDGDGRDELFSSFAGEPGSEQLLLGQIETRCRESGALRVWRPRPLESSEAAGG